MGSNKSCSIVLTFDHEQLQAIPDHLTSSSGDYIRQAIETTISRMRKSRDDGV